MDPITFTFVSCLVLFSIVYIVKRQFRKPAEIEKKIFKDVAVQTDENQTPVSEKGTFTYIHQATKKFQVKPQTFNASTETEDVILDTEELYADLTLFSELLQYNVGTDYKVLKETYQLALENCARKTNNILLKQQETIESIEHNIREEVRSHTSFLLDCFSQQAYHRFLSDRNEADKQRKLKAIDDQEPDTEQFDDFTETEDEELKDLAARNTKAPGDVFTEKSTLAFHPRAAAGKPWDTLKFRRKTRSEEAFQKRHLRQTEYRQVQDHLNRHENPRRRTPLVKELPEIPDRDVPRTTQNE